MCVCVCVLADASLSVWVYRTTGVRHPKIGSVLAAMSVLCKYSMVYACVQL